jgi:site-specific DNA-cytosine methylase
MRIGSLCSGYSGLEAAVQRVVGGEVAWLAEKDEGASKVLASHYPGVTNLGDITTIDWEVRSGSRYLDVPLHHHLSRHHDQTRDA